MAGRRLPDFLIIGAAKSGTTSLYNWLDAHPQVFMSPLKETNFFGYAPESGNATAWGEPLQVSFPVRSLEDYEHLFADAPERATIGESSAAYLESATAPERIHETIPRAKLVVSLRNPVDRAYSGYWMAVSYNGELRPPEEALGATESRVHSGYYHALLSPFFARFDRDRIHVILFEDLIEDPQRVYAELCRFLDLGDSFRPDFAEVGNRGFAPRVRWLYFLLTTSRLRAFAEPWTPAFLRRKLRAARDLLKQPAPPMPAEQRSKLLELYRDDIRALEDLIRRDLSRWLALPEGTAPGPQ